MTATDTRATPRPDRCVPPDGTSGVGAFRALPDGTGRSYTVMDVPSWRSIEQLMRQAQATGGLTLTCNGPCSCYAVLDLYDNDGNVIADFCIPDRRGFSWWYRKVGWRVESQDGTRWDGSTDNDAQTGASR